MDPLVVVVEDDPDIALLLDAILTGDGYRVVSCATPDAPELLSSARQASAILIDLMLPEINGVDLARRLRRIHPDVPMLAMSASRYMMELAAVSGLFETLIAKPFNLITLTDALAAVLDSEVLEQSAAV